jgi:hypothetical protein
MISGPIFDGRARAYEHRFERGPISTNDSTPRFQRSEADKFCGDGRVSDPYVFETDGHDATPEARGIGGKQLETCSACHCEIVAPDRLL